MRRIGLSVVFALTLGVWVTGCATQQAAPNRVESLAFTWATNVVTVTNSVTVTNTAVVTNIAIIPVFTTNVNNVVATNWVKQELYQTNVVTQTVPQVVWQTNYVSTPSAAATNTVQAAGGIVNTFAPGIGTIASTIILALLGWYSAYRNNQGKAAAQQVAANTIQGLETAREIIGALPNGKDLLAKYDAWLMAHQQDAQLANEIGQLVTSLTKGNQWADAAAGIVRAATTPKT